MNERWWLSYDCSPLASPQTRLLNTYQYWNDYFHSLETVIVDKDLKQRRRRRQRELQKRNRLRLAKKKKQICTCITLFCTLLCRHCTTTTWNSTCYGGRELKTMTFFFFFWTSIQSFRIQLQKKKANIWRIEQVGIITINFEERDVTFEVSSSYSPSSLLHKLPNNTDRERKVEIFNLQTLCSVSSFLLSV